MRSSFIEAIGVRFLYGVWVLILTLIGDRFIGVPMTRVPGQTTHPCPRSHRVSHLATR